MTALEIQRRRGSPERWNSRRSSSEWRETDLKLIFSEVHQMFGRYSGTAVTDEGEELQIEDLIGFAEEHQARW